MSDRPTPRTDAAAVSDCSPHMPGGWVTAHFAKDLERKADELAEALEELQAWRDRGTSEKDGGLGFLWDVIDPKMKAALAKWKEGKP